MLNEACVRKTELKMSGVTRGIRDGDRKEKGGVDYVKHGVHMHKNIKNKMKIEKSKDLLEGLCSEPTDR